MAKRGEYSFGPAGARLWTAISKDYVLEPHEQALLVQLCRTIDTAEDLQARWIRRAPSRGPGLRAAGRTRCCLSCGCNALLPRSW